MIIGLAFWFSYITRDSKLVKQAVEHYGYIGIFIIAVISGFNLAVPIPAISFLPLFLEAGLDIWVVTFIIAVGVTIADMIAFFLGRAGRHIIGEHKIVARLERLQKRNPHLPILILFLFASFAPVPNEVLGVPMGFMGYNKWLVLIAVFLGNVIFNSLFGLGVTNLYEIIQ